MDLKEILKRDWSLTVRILTSSNMIGKYYCYFHNRAYTLKSIGVGDTVEEAISDAVSKFNENDITPILECNICDDYNDDD